LPYKGSGGHPLAAEQVPMADALTACIQDNFGYLFTRDTDGDGQNDVNEVSLGTDPGDSNSFFAVDIELTSPGPAGSVCSTASGKAAP
jgi:hypothetical protein